MKGKLWKNTKLKKLKGKYYVGSYVYVKGEREFHLTPVGGGKHIAFESFQAARQPEAGWVYGQ